MSAATSLSQQSQLADDAYLSLTGAIRGKNGIRSGMDVQGREEYDSARFADQAWSFGHWTPSMTEYER